jgi:two-component system sensor histidine kinase YesM
MTKKYLFSYKDWNFKKKLIVIISALIIAIIILISVFNYVLYSRNFTKQTINQTQQIIEQISINVDTYLDELFRLNLAPYYDDEIMSELDKKYTTKEENLNKKRMIESFLASVMTLPRSEILRVYILTDDNLYSYTRTPYDMEDYDNYPDTDWYKQAIGSSTPVFVPIHSEKVFGDKPIQIFSIAQRIRSKEDNTKVLAVIKVDANYTGIKSICDQVQLQEKGSLFILDENKNIVYQNNKLEKKDIIDKINMASYHSDGDFTETIDSEKYIINITSLKSTDLKVIAINSYNELNKAAKAIRNMTILLALLGMVLALSILFIFVQNFFKPLFNIVRLMKLVQNGDLTVQVKVKNNDEIGYLAKSFNRMIVHIKDILDKNTQLVKEIYESRYLQKEAQYNILCSQIKPHFLYNTLNTISLLIKCKNSEGAIQSIEKLSYFLRGIMNADKNITLSTEIELVDSYLGILKARYGDNLSYEISIAPDYTAYLIPALTLQPIVENAVIHGCEMKRGKSIIQIFSSSDDKYLYLHVKDNGIGIEEMKLDQLNYELSNVTSIEGPDPKNISITESIGLINVNKRIRLKYGDDYGIHIVSSAARGTHVILQLPLKGER